MALPFEQTWRFIATRRLKKRNLASSKIMQACIRIRASSSTTKAKGLVFGSMPAQCRWTGFRFKKSRFGLRSPRG